MLFNDTSNKKYIKTGKYRLFIPVFMALILCACSQKENEAQTHDKAQSYIDRANAYAGQGQFKAAIIEARNALQIDQNNLDAMLSMSKVFNTLGHYDESISMLEPLSTTVNFTAPAKLVLLNAYIKQGKADSAKKILQEIPANSVDAIDLSLAQAELANLEQHHTEALQRLNTQLKQHPNDLQLLTAKAKTYGYAGQLGEAAKTAQKALEVNPNYEPALTMMALISYQTGKLEVAEDYLSNALVNLPNTDIITPRKSQVLKRLTHVLSSLGRSNEALIYAKLLSDAAPEQQLLENQFNEAVQAYNAGELDKAKELLEKLHEKVADKNTTGTLLASINYQQGNLQAADAYLQQHIDPETADKSAMQLMALTHLRRGNFNEAAQLVSKEIEKNGESATLLNLLAASQLAEKKYSQAQNTLNKAKRLDSKQAMNYILQSQLAQQQGNSNLAIKVLQEGISASDYDLELVRTLLRQYESAKSNNQAFALTQKLVLEKPNDANSYLLHAIAATKVNNLVEAEKSLLKALELEPQLSEAQLTLGKLEFNRKNYIKARQWFNKAIANQSANTSSAYDGLLATYTIQKQTKQGTDALNTWLDKGKTHIMAALTLARHYADKQQYKQSESYIEQALTLDQGNNMVKNFAGSYYAMRAKRLEASGNYEQIRQLLINGLSQSPNNTSMLKQLALNEVRAGKKKEALKILQRIESLPSIPKTALDIIKGDIYYALQEHKKALNHFRSAWQRNQNDAIAIKLHQSLQANKMSTREHLEQWLAVAPRSINAHLNKAISLQTLGQNASAQEWYEKTLALAPQHLIALNNLAWLYFEDKKNKKALTLAQKAFQLSESAPLIADTYGWILVNSGQKERGISVLKQAAISLPNNKDIQNHLNQAEQM